MLTALQVEGNAMTDGVEATVPPPARAGGWVIIAKMITDEKSESDEARLIRFGTALLVWYRVRFGRMPDDTRPPETTIKEYKEPDGSYHLIGSSDMGFQQTADALLQLCEILTSVAGPITFLLYLDGRRQDLTTVVGPAPGDKPN